jgi:protein-L-isoaspartate(D-aspartate) O-methyltransferase
MARVSASRDPRLEQVFCRVLREAFLPPGPWKVLVEGWFVETPSSDPAHVYQNVAIALDARKGINNGEPYLHAMWIGAVAPQPGETITQIGPGDGLLYRHPVTPRAPGGHLTGFEIDRELAEIARRNLATFESVSVVAGDATSLEVPPSDLIYVSAAVVNRRSRADSTASRRAFDFSLAPNCRCGPGDAGETCHGGLRGEAPDVILVHTLCRSFKP